MLVGATDLACGLIRMYSTLATQESQQFSPCRDWEAACQALDIDPTIDLLEDPVDP